jgi:hypothetical protein
MLPHMVVGRRHPRWLDLQGMRRAGEGDDMSNPAAFPSTLAESAAAIVAIVGGFLVSRLVALSSEREGLRR